MVRFNQGSNYIAILVFLIFSFQGPNVALWIDFIASLRYGYS